jgi:uncharacterized membrane protein YeaQ/YmgE (transglycosylase-associated protein family)
MQVNKKGGGIIIDIMLGIVGAFVGGFLFNAIAAQGVSGFNFYSLFIAVVGSVVFLLVYHTLFRRERG